MLPRSKRLEVGKHSTTLSTRKPRSSSTCRWLKKWPHVRAFSKSSIFWTFLLSRLLESIFVKAIFFVEECQWMANFVRESGPSKGIACKSTKMVWKAGFLAMCGRRVLNSRPRDQNQCKRFACPSNPPTMPAAFQDATTLEFHERQF